MGQYLERYREIIGRYIEAYSEAEKKRKPGSGLFGFGQGPGDFPCHEELDKQTAALAEELAADEAGAEETAEIVKAVLQAEQGREWPEAARWSVLATQRHVLPLIPKLSAAEKQEILAWYEKAYPRRSRVPIQKQILKALAE